MFGWFEIDLEILRVGKVWLRTGLGLVWVGLGAGPVLGCFRFRVRKTRLRGETSKLVGEKRKAEGEKNKAEGEKNTVRG